jgi:hypothetical protein
MTAATGVSSFQSSELEFNAASAGMSSFEAATYLHHFINTSLLGATPTRLPWRTLQHTLCADRVTGAQDSSPQVAKPAV